MGLYRLKQGGHVQGGSLMLDKEGKPTGHTTPLVFFTANNPKANILESEDNLAESDPDRFAVYEGPRPHQLGITTGGAPPQTEPRPPGPPTEADFAAAAALKVSSTTTSPDDLRALAQRLREQADAMEEAASNSEKSMKEASKQAAKKSAPKAPEITEEEAEDDEYQDEDNDLESQTVEELKQTAAAEGVEISSSMRKDDIIARIRRAREEED